MALTVEADLHLFIIWSAARAREADIVADLGAHFVIRDRFDLSWSPSLFADNMTRLYGLSLPPGSFKETHVGTGPFMVVIVEDQYSAYGLRETSRGEARVNTAVFDAKARYREWTGGGHRVHSTTTPQEFNHDVTLLLGVDAADYRKRVRPPWSLEAPPERGTRDLEGAHGWASLPQFFYVLGATVPYVVLRNFAPLPDGYFSEAHGDIDLLVEDSRQAEIVTGARTVFDEPHRVHMRVDVAGSEVLFDFRFVGDQYNDRRWQERILADAREHRAGVRIPSADDYRFGLLYHALIHKRVVAPDYLEAFAELFSERLVSRRGELRRGVAARVVSNWMRARRYSVTVPEPSVPFNSANAMRVQIGLGPLSSLSWVGAAMSRERPSLPRRVRARARVAVIRTLGQDRATRLRNRLQLPHRSPGRQR